MASSRLFYDHWGSQNDNAFTGTLSFTTNTTTTDWNYSPQFGTNYITQTTAGTSANTQLVFDFHNTTTETTTNTIRLTGNEHLTWRGNDWNFSEKGKLKNALMQIFKKVPKDLIKTKEDKILVKAKEKSEKMLKEWLSPAEYAGLKNKGEIELPSKEEEDVIFIVKRDPNEMVQVKKKGQYQHKLCVVAEAMEYPVGDQLLSKIALLKSDEKGFKELAIKHR